MIKWFSIVFLLVVNWCFAKSVEEATVKGKIIFQDDTIHLEFSGKNSWNYSIDKKAKLVEILIDPLDLDTIKNILRFKSSLLKKINVIENQEDHKTLISFEMANDLEIFDYLVESPSRLIVDLYQKPTEKKNIKSQNVKKIKSETKEVRAPASADFLKLEQEAPVLSQVKLEKNKLAGIYDGADPFYERFSMKDYEIKEESIIMSKENYYIPFPDIDLPVEDWNKIKNAETVFQIAPTEEPENKHVRLLQTLMNNKRPQVFFKTYNWFQEKYPESEYSDIVRNMSIQVHLSEWETKNDVHHYDLAVQKMREIINKDGKHPMAEKYSMLLGILAYEKKDYFNSLRSFQNHMSQELWNKKGSYSADLSALGIALSFLKLNQFEDAYRELDKLENSSVFEDLKSEAAYRKGDVLLRQKKYDLAIKEYKAAIAKRPKSELKFPNAFYNQAQAQFLLEQYKESLNTYRDFIKKFPQDNVSPYAMTRVGELLEILGADKTKVIGAYLETYFRSGENPSAIVARLRLLTAKMKGMKPKEVDSTIKEITELVKRSDLPGIQQFATVLIAEGFQQKKSYDKALNLLIGYYKQNPSIVDTNLFSKRIVSNIFEKIETSVGAGDFLSALKIYNEYYDNWLKPSTRLDIKYQIGRAYEQGGVYEPAIKYYSEVLNKVYSYRGSREGREKLVKEKLPSESLLNLRLAEVEDKNKNYNKAFEYLRAIKEPNLLSEADQIARIILSTSLYEKRGDFETAILYLTELLTYWKGQPFLVAEPYFKLSELQYKKGEKEEALKSLNKIATLMDDTNLVSIDLYRKSLEKLASINEEKKDFDQAIFWYEKLLDKFEDKISMASTRYRLGKIYFDIGKIQKASEIWAKFKGDNSESWKKIAKEQIRSFEWENENKKFIDRFPASKNTP